MSDQPKPTGEWTHCGSLIYNGGKLVTDVAAAHNAELAASDANAKSWHDDTVRCEEELAELREQLAAERRAVRDINHLNRIDELERQLAAETLRANQKEGAFMVASEANRKLREQLSDERENTKQLVAQPKPTGEWTQEWLRQYLAGYSSYDLQLKAIADAHNAAVAEATAAEREKRENSDRKWIVAAGQLRQQLADALAKIGAK